jgi:Leucine-rich repeat (LRR) protein
LSDLDGYRNSSLTRLDCPNNRLTWMPFLPFVKILDCSNNLIGFLNSLTKDLKPGNSKLTRLTCSENRLIAFRCLEHCRKLCELNAYRNDIFDASAIEGKGLLECTKLELNCLSLRVLRCSHNQLTNLNGLEFCGDLCELACSKALSASVKILKVHLPKLEVKYCF